MEERQAGANPSDGERYLSEMAARYARKEGDEIVIELPEEHERALGNFLIRVVFGFFLGLGTKAAPQGALAAASQTGEEARTVTTR